MVDFHYVRQGDLPRGVDGVFYRSHTAIARGQSMDQYLTSQETESLYQKWNRAWGEPYELPGSQPDITCEMVLVVEPKALVKVYGKELAARFHQVAEQNHHRSLME